MIKRRFLFAALLLIPFQNTNTTDNRTAKTFMATRPIYQNINASQFLFHDAIYSDKNSLIQITPLYQKSMAYAANKEYFLINNKQSLRIKGSNSSEANRDICANWLEISNTNFSGNVTVSPEQTQYGVVADYNLSLKDVSDWTFFKNLWIGFSIPWVCAKQNLKLSQENVQNEGDATGPTDIAQALKRNNLKYSRMDDTERTKIDVPELRLKFGAKYEGKNGFKIRTQSSLIIPLESKPDPTYLFDPTLGNNGHFGTTSGVYFDIPLTEKDEAPEFNIFIYGEYNYYFKNTQKRTIELYNKPWSRYLLLRKNGEPATIPAANELTLDVKVEPYNFAEVSLGLRLKAGSCQAQIGYGIWAHGTETLSLTETFTTEYGIAGPGTGSANASTMLSWPTSDDTNFTTIRESDLDLNSAAAQSAVVHKIHGEIGMLFEKKKLDTFVGVGGSLDIPHYNTALKNWSLWGKVGLNF